MKTDKTIFLWPGSKDRYWSEVKKYIPNNIEHYYEPFVGGGSILFKVLHNFDIVECGISDVNMDLLNCYQALIDDTNFLIENLPKSKDKEIFLSFLNSQKDENYLVEAKKFLYLNRNRFYGCGGWMNADRYCYKSLIGRLNNFKNKIKRVKIKKNCYDYAFKENSFIFCDPPYPETNNKSCYKIDNNGILELNLKYLDFLNEKNHNFLFITKNIKIIEDKCRDLKFHYHIKDWDFRRPQKNKMVSEELWIYKNALTNDLKDMFE